MGKRGAIFIGKRIARVEDVISHELPTRSVKIIGAALGDNIDHSAKHASVLRFIVVRLHLKFLHVIHDWRNDLDPIGEVGKRMRV